MKVVDEAGGRLVVIKYSDGTVEREAVDQKKKPLRRPRRPPQKSGLKPETIKQLLQLDQMFNVEAHRGLFSLFRESHRLMVEHKLDVSLVPASDPLRDTMYVNRATETNWMIHRLVPYMRRKDTPKDAEWDRKWKLLEDHFRWMVEAFGAIGKPIAPAFIEMIDAKFTFGASTYYSEPKMVEPKEKVRARVLKNLVR